MRWFEAYHARTQLDPNSPVSIMFYGLYTPLQGASVIGHAIRSLIDSGLSKRFRVTMIGSGQDLVQTRAAVGDAGEVVSWSDWVPSDQLPSLVAAHEISLGIFGTTTKASEVIPNKVYQSAAAGCAIVTSATPPQKRELSGAAQLIPAGDADALAAALTELIIDPDVLSNARSAARDRAVTRFAPVQVSAPIETRLAELLALGVDRAADS